MKLKRDNESESPWQNLPSYRKTEQKNDVLTKVYDAIIIGEGITGITTALMLQKAIP